MDTTTQAYLEILEKTNQQLSLWYNPYGLMIGILTALVALLAILFAFILWRQQKDYKDSFKNFLDELKKIADGEIGKAIIEARKVLDEKLADADRQLKEIKDSDSKAKKDIEEQIKELKKSKESLDVRPVFHSGGIDSIVVGGSNSTTGTAFISPNSSVWGGGSTSVTGYSVFPNSKKCGFCGAQNYISSNFCTSCGNPLG